MLYLSSDSNINFILDLPNNNEPNLSTLHYERKNEGPGYADPWLALENSENAWFRLETNERIAKKPKIIFCNTLINLRPLAEEEQHFLAVILERFEVYLWQGNSIPFSAYRPIHTIKEFYDHRHHMQGAKKSDVVKVLSQQGLTINQFIILDFAEYACLLDRLSQVKQDYIGIFEFRRIEENFYFYLAQAAHLDLRLIDIDQLEEYQQLLDFSKITSITTSIVDAQWAKVLFSYFANLEMLIVETPLETLEISAEFSQIQHLVVKNSDNLKKLIINNTQLKALTLIYNKSLAFIETPEIISLKHLTIRSCYALENIEGLDLVELESLKLALNPSDELTPYQNQYITPEIANFAKLKVLGLDYLEVDMLDLSQNQELTRISINFLPQSKSKSQIKLPTHNNLTYLHLCSCGQDKLDLSNYEKLEYLSLSRINRSPQSEVFFPTRAPGLKTLIIASGNVYSSILQRYSALTFLRISHMPNGSSQLDLQENKQLKNAGFINCCGVSRIIFPEIRLKNLALVNTPYFTEIINNIGLSIENFIFTPTQVVSFPLAPHVISKLSSLSFDNQHNGSHADVFQKLLTHAKELKGLQLVINQIPDALFEKGLSSLDYLDITMENPQNLPLDMADKFPRLKTLSIEIIPVKNNLADSKEDKLATNSFQEVKIENLTVPALIFNISAPCNTPNYSINIGNINTELLTLRSGLYFSKSIILVKECPQIRQLDIKRVKIDNNTLRDSNLLQVEALRFEECEFEGAPLPPNCPKLKYFAASEVVPPSYRLYDELGEGSDELNESNTSSLILDFTKSYAIKSITYRPADHYGSRAQIKIIYPPNACLHKLEIVGENSNLQMENQPEQVNQLLLISNNVEEYELLPENSTLSCLENLSKDSTSTFISSDDILHAFDFEEGTSFIIPNPLYQADTNTAECSDYIAPEEYEFSVAMFNKHRRISRHNYRVEIIDELVESGDSDYFFQQKIIDNQKLIPIDPSKYEFGVIPKDPEDEEDEEEFLSELVNNLGRKEVIGTVKFKNVGLLHLFMLPNTQPKHQLLKIYTNQACEFNLYWYPPHGAYYLDFTPSIQKKLLTNFQTLELYYVFKNEHIFFPTKNAQLSTKPAAELLPVSLIKKLDALLRTHPHLSPLCDPNYSLASKIQLINNYGKNFKTTEVEEDQDDTIPLLQIINEGKGVCRHRGDSTMVLHRYNGVMAHQPRNERHARIEIHYHHNGELQLHTVDLGGASKGKDYTSPERRKNPLAEMVKPPLHTGLTLEFYHLLKKRYEEIFYKSIIKRPLNSWSELLEIWRTETVAPLIMMQPDQSPTKYNQSLQFFLSNEKWNVHERYLYIAHPDELKTYFTVNAIQRGGTVRVKGPLQTLILEGGVLLINANHFTPHQSAIFKVLLQEREFEGLKLSPNLCIIFLIPLVFKASAAFYSRGTKFYPSKDFFQVNPVPKDSIDSTVTNSSTFSVDLFDGYDWRELLLGNITYQGHVVNLEEGILASAVSKGSELNLYNMPNDPGLYRLLRHIVFEHSFYYNGKKLAVHQSFTIFTYTSDELPSLNPAIQLLRHNEYMPNKSRRPIYLSMHNWHELFKQLLVDEKTHTGHTIKGWLEHYDSDSHVFYLFGYIPSFAWRRLLHVIKEKFPQKSFQFVALPGCQLVCGETNLEISAEEKTSLIEAQRVYVSNDPDQLAFELAKDIPNALIVPVDKTMGFAQLFASIKHIQKKEVIDSGQEKILNEFSICWSKLFDKLREENNLILLNGELSSTTYYELLPLLAGERLFYFNGVEYEIKSPLVWVMPMSSKNTIGPINTILRDYSRKDYFALFSSENDDYGALEQVLTFYELANKLPHTGAGRPLNTFLTVQRLRNLVQAYNKHIAPQEAREPEPPFKRLRSSRQEEEGKHEHSHNPIKGWFHYDYPHESEDYAYLNVIAKVIFANYDSSPVSQRKLKRLYALFENNIDKMLVEARWRLLNCFRGSDLDALFNNSLVESIENHRGSFPLPATQVMERVLSRLKPTLEENPSPLIAHETKIFSRLQSLISLNTHPVIFVKGPPGVGKTYVMEILQKQNPHFKIYKGMGEILDWLQVKEPQPEERHILLFDEGNKVSEGTLDFLKNIYYFDQLKNRKQTDQISVYYEKQIYYISRQHMIVANGNPEYFPRRAYKTLLRNAHTLYCKLMQDELLKKVILEPIFIHQNNGMELEGEEIEISSMPSIDLRIADFMLKAFHALARRQPFHPLSIRDLESLAYRFIVLVKHEHADNLSAQLQLLLQACLAELAGVFETAIERQAYIKELTDIVQKIFSEDSLMDLEKQISVSEVLDITDKISITSEKSYILSTIEQSLLLRQKRAEFPAMPYKRGILLQGLSGEGKSTVLRAILEKNGYTEKMYDPNEPLENSPAEMEDISKYYMVINAGNDEYWQEKLHVVVKKGYWLIVEELNLDPQMEDRLSNYLTGYDENQNKLPETNWGLLTTQNPGHMEGTLPQALSLQNRLLLINVNNTTVQELEKLVGHRLKCSEQNLMNFFANTNYMQIKQQFMEQPHVKAQLLESAEEKALTVPSSKENVTLISQAFAATFDELRNKEPEVTMRHFYNTLGKLVN